MNRAYRYSLRLGQRARLRRRLALGVLATFAVCALAAVWRPAPEPVRVAAAAGPVSPRAAAARAQSGQQRPARIIYPYSVVPGGVASQAELVQVLRTDKVVAAHYAGFDVAKARPVTVAAPRAVHVSYRKGDRIYWTARKVMLKPGETLFTDGTNEMRARCANRISDVARFPVEAQAPDLQLLEASFEEGLEQEDGALVAAAAPDLPGQDPATAPAGTSFSSAATASAIQTRSRWMPMEAGGLALAPPPGELRNMGLALGNWGSQGDPVAGNEGASGPASGSAPPLLVAADTETLPKDTPASDPGPFMPKPEPAGQAQPDSTLVDASRPAEVPEPATRWLLAVAMTALLAMRRKG